MKKIIFICMVLLSGCVRDLPIDNIQNDIQGFKLPHEPRGNMATVYIVRPYARGWPLKLDISIDGKINDQSDSIINNYMGYTKGNEYIYFDVKPGAYTIYSNGENVSSQDFIFKKGDIVFFEQKPLMGIISLRSNLSRIDSNRGFYCVKNLKPGNMGGDKK